MAGSDAPWRKLYARVRDMSTISARVGVLASKGGGAVAPGGTASLVDIAAFMEFGTATIPARSFLRSTFLIRRVNALATMNANITKGIVLGLFDVRKGVGILGAWGAAEVKNTITEIDIPPPLADSTVMAKGSSKPLVDTGQLLGSITWEIVDTKASK